MCFEELRSVSFLGKIQARASVGVSDESALCCCAGHSDAVGSAILVHAGLSDDALNGVSVLERCRKSFEEDSPNTVSSCVTISIRLYRC